MIYATCIECNERAVVDEEAARLNIENECECDCPGGLRCAADDAFADHRLDDPRHTPYSNLKG